MLAWGFIAIACATADAVAEAHIGNVIVHVGDLTLEESVCVL